MPPDPNAPKKKAGKGCLIALAVVGTAGMLVVGAIAFGIYEFVQTKEGKATWTFVEEAARMGIEAQSAPGTDEVRALGCEQAMAMDFRRFSQLNPFLDAGPMPEGMFSMMVTCQVGVFGTPPSCEEVARVYQAAAHPTAPFVVNVQAVGHTKPTCTSLHDKAGHKLEDLPGAQ